MPNLFIDVEARFAKFQDSLDGLSRNAAKSVGQIDRAFGALKTTFAAVGAGISVAAFTGIVKGAIDAADSLNDLSKKTGIAADTLGGLGFAAQQAGGTLESFADATTKLNRSIAEAGAGSKEKVEAFRLLGISVTDAAGRLKSADAVMLELADKFESYEDGPNKVALAIALLGKAGADAIPILNEGGEKIRQNTEYYKRFSAVSQKVVEDADQFNDTLVKLRLISGALGTKIASELLPVMQGLADHMLRAKEESDLFATSAAGVKTVLQALTVFGANVAYVFQQIGVEIAGIGLQLAALAKLDFKEFKSLGDAMKTQAREARKEIDDFSDRILGAGQYRATAQDRDDAEVGRARFPGARRRQAPALPNTGAESRAEALEKAKEALIQARAKITIDAENNAAKARLAILDHFYKEGFANEEHYWQTRANVQRSAYEVERKLLDETVANRQKAVDTFKTPAQKNTKEYHDATRELLEAQAKRNKLDDDFNQQGVTDVLAKAKATQEYERAIKNVNIQLDQLRGNTAKATGESFDQQNERLLREADARGDAEGRARIEALRNATVAQARFNEVRERANDVTARLALEEERIQNNLRVGAIGELTALRQTEQARLNALNTLKLTRQELDAIAESSGMEKLRLDAEKFGVQMETLATQTNLVADRFNKAFEDSVSSAFADFITGAKDAKEAFKSFANSVIKNLADIYAKQLATQLFGGGNGSGGVGGILARLFSGSSGGSAVNFSGFGGGQGAATAAETIAFWGSAKGNIFDGVKRFARGGIVDKPTFFKFADGGTIRSGLMGESGPEAIVPLRRGPDGRLGIESAGGGGVVINNSYHIDSRTDRGEIIQMIERSRRQTIADVADQKRRGGTYGKVMRG